MNNKAQIDLIRKIRRCETHDQLDECINEFEEWKESITPSFWSSLFEDMSATLRRQFDIREVESSIKIMDSFISCSERLLK